MENTGKQMTLFVERKKAFEAKFAHDANLDFKTEARRNTLLGVWVAETLGLSETAHSELVASYTVSNVLSRDPQCIVAKAAADLSDHASIDAIELKLVELAEVAQQQMKNALS